MSMTTMSPVTVEEAATHLGLHPQTIRRLCREGVLRARKVSAREGRGKWLIDPKSVLDWLSEEENGSKPWLDTDAECAKKLGL